MHEIDLALLILRVVAGVTMAMHGYNKTKNLAGTAGWFNSMGMKPGALHARLAAFTEIGGGLMLAVGLLTPLAGASFVGLMVVAGWTSHRKNGFFINRPGQGWEYTLILATIGLTLAGLGAGELSLDNAFGISFDEWVGLAIGVAGGIGGIALMAACYRPPKG